MAPDTLLLEAVVFDMDGLMLDTEPLYKVAWQSGCRELDTTGADFPLGVFERDLAMVPPTMPVVTFNHIPFFSSSEGINGYDDKSAAPTLITVNGKTAFRHTVSNAGCRIPSSPRPIQKARLHLRHVQRSGPPPDYVLFLRPGGDVMTPYWAPLAPINEQVRPDGDPWIDWIHRQLSAR